MNALRHGLRAEVLPAARGEEAEELAALARGTCATYRPEDPVEADLAAQMALALWKGRRADRLDAQVFDGVPVLGTTLVKAHGPTLTTVSRYKAAAQQEMRRALATLLAHRRARQAGLIPAAPDEPGDDAVMGDEPERPASAVRDEPEPAAPFDTNEFPVPDQARRVGPGGGGAALPPGAPPHPFCTNEFPARAEPEPSFRDQIAGMDLTEVLDPGESFTREDLDRLIARFAPGPEEREILEAVGQAMIGTGRAR